MQWLRLPAATARQEVQPVHPGYDLHCPADRVSACSCILYRMESRPMTLLALVLRCRMSNRNREGRKVHRDKQLAPSCTRTDTGTGSHLHTEVITYSQHSTVQQQYTPLMTRLARV